VYKIEESDQVPLDAKKMLSVWYRTCLHNKQQVLGRTYQACIASDVIE
jgi:hypothetical protein